jgi:hypothetical protein
MVCAGIPADLLWSNNIIYYWSSHLHFQKGIRTGRRKTGRWTGRANCYCDFPAGTTLSATYLMGMMAARTQPAVDLLLYSPAGRRDNGRVMMGTLDSFISGGST